MSKRLIPVLILISVVCTAGFYCFNSGRLTYPFDGDALGYYSYLPATFIFHHPLDQDIVPDSIGIDSHTYVCLAHNQVRTPLGHANNQYTYGVAAMESPFFFAAHWYDKATGGAGNGYSENYLTGLRIGSLFFCLAGLCCLYIALRRTFGKVVVVATLSAVLIGTNLLWFTFTQVGMSHVPLFFLYSLLLLLTIRLHETGKLKFFLLTGFVCGMITVIRPVDILCVLIPLLYDLNDKKSIQNKISLLRENYLKVIAAAAVFAIPIVPQLLYWHAVSGRWVYYSYGNQGFEWAQPHIWEGMMGAHNGWLPYSPVMVFSLIGFLFWKANPKWRLAAWVIFPIYVYVIYSWYCYSYINGYGSRPMLHMYPLLTFCFAATTNYVFKKGTMLQMIYAVLVCLLISVNVSFSLSQSKGMLISDESNFVFNKAILYKTKLSYNDLVTYDIAELQPDSNRIRRIAILGVQDYQDSALSTHVMMDSSSGNKLYHTGEAEYIPNIFKFSYHKATFKDAKWIRVKGRFMYPYGPDYFKHMFIVYFENNKWVGLRVENKVGVYEGLYSAEKSLRLDQSLTQVWSEVQYYVRIPNHISEGDPISVQLWNTGKRELFMDNLEAALYR